MMGNCGSICDCLGKRKEAKATEGHESPIENPFRPTRPYSSAQVYTILGPHPNGLKY